MVTTVTKTIKSSGGDYTTLIAWEAAQQGDLVAADELRQAECYNFAETGGSLIIDGSTTDATRYMRVYTPTAQRHTGTAGTGFRRVADGSTDNLCRLADDYVRIEGVEMDGGDQSNTDVAGMRVMNVGCRVSHCLVYNINSLNGRGIWNSSTGPWYAYNNIVYGTFSGAFGGGLYTEVSCFWYNNTCTGQPVNFSNQGGTVVAKNNISQNASGFGFYPGTYTGSVFNLSEDATAPGTDALTSTVVTFNNEGGNDFRLSNSDTAAKNSGTSLAADSDLPFSDDIFGTARPQGATWDRGAHEESTGAASAPRTWKLKAGANVSDLWLIHP